MEDTITITLSREDAEILKKCLEVLDVAMDAMTNLTPYEICRNMSDGVPNVIKDVCYQIDCHTT